MLLIKDYINNYSDYKVDRNYQREENVWSLDDEQCLIDTILREEPMPLFFFNQKTDTGEYYVVDGQQRLNTIKKFSKNELKLNKKYSREEDHNKDFNGKNPISTEQRKIFLNYKLREYIFEDYSDGEVRRIFSKLQRGTPLNLGERLNALPGKIVPSMRTLAKMSFLLKSVGVKKKRYNTYPDAARLLYYEKKLVKDAGQKQLFSFFDNYSNLDSNDSDYQKCEKHLKFLAKCFPPNPGNYQYLRRHAWINAVYTMISELTKDYSIKAQVDNIREFIENFHGKVYNQRSRQNKFVYQEFFDNVRGGFSEKNIKTRRDILIKEFINKYNPPKLDEQRQISDEEKISCYHRANRKCEKCLLDFKDYKEPEYHHTKRYIDGGETDPENIEVLCVKCHAIQHKPKKDQT